MTGVVKTGAIPYTDVQLEAITSGAASLRTVASAVRDGTADIVTAWSGISGSYEGPSDQELFAVMTPIGPQGTTFGDDLDTAAKALDTFVTEVTPIVAALKAYVTRAEQLHRDVDAFTPKTATTEYGNNATVESWDQDETLTDENNAIINGVAAQVVAYQAAERTCANTIRGLSGLQPLHAMSGSGSDDALAYGYDKLPAGTKLPWGTASERKESCSEKTVDFLPNMLTGVAVDGIWGTVKGLGTLVGLDGTGFHLGTAATSWSGVLALTGFNTKTMQKDPDLQREAWTQLGKATVGWDEWGRDPGRAAGQALWGIGSIVVPIVGQAGKLGAVGKVGEVAGAIGKAGKYLDLVDAGAWVSKGLTKVLPRLDELKTIMTKGVGDDAVGSTGRLADFKTGLGDYLHGRHGDTDVEVPPARTEADTDVRAGSDANARADGGDATVHAPEREPALVGAGGRGEHGETATGDGGSTSGSHGGAGHGGDSAGHGGSGHGTDADHGAGGGRPDGDGHDGSGTPPPHHYDRSTDPVFSDDPSGPGWERDESARGDAERPGYGQPHLHFDELGENYRAPDDPTYKGAGMSDEVRALVDDWGNPNSLYGKDADGNYLTRDGWEDRYIDWNEKWQSYAPEYPGNAGAVAGHRVDWTDPQLFVQQYGSQLDRLGADKGEFLSFPGTSFEERALPPSNLSDKYSTFDFDAAAFEGKGLKIEVSEIAPAFGHPGGGLQVRFFKPGDPIEFVSVTDLKRMGILS
ncbi:TNT domain-containing protein [Curtobacterium sp. WHRI 8282]|uniref:TNT domain-containing protein n=1 Tax=Curtobacterium sp. WHRI 8282 TaxID=3162559 RepID=UPI0032EFFC65